jgi:transcriptional regulator of arginine metabolism
VRSETATKTRRQRAILDLVRSAEVSSQEDLGRRLRRHGFQATQATLSRDLRELRLSRLPTPTGYRYLPAPTEGNGEGQAPAAPRLRAVTAEEVTGVEANESVVIVRTLSGRAQGVAVFLDHWRHPDLMGTIAGDDTILVLPRSVRRTGRLRKAVMRLFDVKDIG